MRLLRLAHLLVALKYGLDEFLTGHERFRAVRPMARALTFWRDTSAPRAVRLRLALEDLGPIFVKFGQMLSTRRDLIPLDIADELAKLQDRVPPFPSEQVIATLTPRLRQARRPGVQVVRPRRRSRARRSRRCISPSCRTARRSRSRCCGPNIAQVIEKDISLHARRRDAGREAVVRRQAPAPARGRRRVREDARATSSTSRARRRTARSCGAISSIRRCCSSPRCTGTGAAPK